MVYSVMLAYISFGFTYIVDLKVILLLALFFKNILNTGFVSRDILFISFNSG